MCGSDDGGGGESSDGFVGPTCKKPQKRQRVPKRGPGVAELEKILREQEKNIITSTSTDNPEHREINVVDQGRFRVHPSYIPMSRPSSSHNIDVHYLQLPSINSSSCSSSIASFSTANKPLPSNNGAGNSTVGGGGGGVFLPEQAFFPWMADEGKLGGGISLPRSGPVVPNTGMRKKQYCHNPTSMMNQFPGSASSSNNPSSVGLCDQIEPPSSQRLYHNYPSIGPHEKVIGVKRPLPPPSVDNRAAPTCLVYQAPQEPSQRHGTEQPTSCNHEIGYNTNLIQPMLWDAKWDVPPLEFNYLQNYDTELQQGAPDGNYSRLVPGNTAFLLPFQFPEFDHTIPFQDSNKRPMLAEPDQNKPFYSFLPSKEQTKETLRGLNIKRGNGDGEDDIDLDLRLSSR